MKHKLTYYYRKTHRYFGVIIGIQFLFWTLGGLFFSWSNMDQIHGDINRKQTGLIKDLNNWKSVSQITNKPFIGFKIDSLISFKVINLLGHPHYQLRYFEKGKKKTTLVNSVTGVVKSPVNKDEALLIAKEVFVPLSEVREVVYITKDNIHLHHEYRGRPLPAYSVEFEHESGTRVYISTEFGEVMAFRNTNWRIFDFLWMMHTMDFKSRDHFGNFLLRIFSVLGLITILSGFLLYIKTSRRFRKRKQSYSN